MKEYTIVHVDGKPDWRIVEELEIGEQLWLPPVDIAAWAQLAWDDGNLYVRLRAREKKIRAEHREPLDMVCEDSCLEFFFSPVPGDPRYFNMEFNPNTCLYLGYGDGRNATRLLPEKNWFDARSERTEDGWWIEYRVPFEFVRIFAPGFRPKTGDSMRANCYKCGDMTEREHYLAWNPCVSETPNFHRPQDFGLMHFG